MLFFVFSLSSLSRGEQHVTKGHRSPNDKAHITETLATLDYRTPKVQIMHFNRLNKTNYPSQIYVGKHIAALLRAAHLDGHPGVAVRARHTPQFAPPES